MGVDYYYQQHKNGNFVPIVLDIYCEAIQMGKVAYKHWFVKKTEATYSKYKFDFASSFPDGCNTGCFVRYKYPYLQFQNLQEEPEYIML